MLTYQYAFELLVLCDVEEAVLIQDLDVLHIIVVSVGESMNNKRSALEVCFTVHVVTVVRKICRLPSVCNFTNAPIKNIYSWVYS